MQDIYPANFNTILESFLDKKLSSFRPNFLKIDLVTLKKELLRQGIRFQELPYPAGAFLLNTPLRDFQKTSFYLNGCVYIQNVSSMLPPVILNPQNGEKILDLCAAPGTKTTQIISLAPRSNVVAIEKNRIRYYKLLANLKIQGIEAVRIGGYYEERYPHKIPDYAHDSREDEGDGSDGAGEEYPGDADEQEFSPVEDDASGEVYDGIPRVRVMLIDGMWVRKKFPEYFDKILVDAPCSAEGRFWVAEPKTFKYWRPNKVKEMVHTQKKLLAAAFFALKQGGELVYSTCTFSPEENEGVIDWFVDKFKDRLEILPIETPLKNSCRGLTGWRGLKSSAPLHLCRRIIPNAYMEGFFVAKLRKI
jgi:16S rRNA (cytosine1407-C5)-methyltransferase